MNLSHVVIGCPANFDLSKQISSAKSVKIAMAFAKRSGWRMLEQSLLKSKKKVEVIIGLNFGITETELLEEWLSLREKLHERFSVKIAPLRPTFHPKVVIARFNDGSGMGVVGSGNLTGGGQGLNVECGVYLTKGSDIRELERWYRRLKAVPLNREIIEKYRPIRERARLQDRRSLDSNELSIFLSGNSPDWYSDIFISDFWAFLKSKQGQNSLKKRVDGARRIRRALNMPSFDFTREGWMEFYRIADFGRIRMAYPEMAKDISKLRKTMRFLVENASDVSKFRLVFDRKGKFHVSGMGINQITKVLTVYKRLQWPLLNIPVHETLRNYGYEIPWSADGYLKFASDMRDLLKNLGQPDFWALDAFCEMKSHYLDRS